MVLLLSELPGYEKEEFKEVGAIGKFKILANGYIKKLAYRVNNFYIDIAYDVIDISLIKEDEKKLYIKIVEKDYDCSSTDCFFEKEKELIYVLPKEPDIIEKVDAENGNKKEYILDFDVYSSHGKVNVTSSYDNGKSYIYSVETDFLGLTSEEKKFIRKHFGINVKAEIKNISKKLLEILTN